MAVQGEYKTTMSDEDIKSFREDIMDKMKQLMQAVSEKDERFAVSDIMLSGSSAEGVRVGNPYEMDIMLVLDMPIEIKEIAENPGFANVHLVVDKDLKLWNDCIDGTALLSVRIKRSFHKLILLVIQRNSEFSNIDITSYVSEGTAVTLSIGGKVDIDLVISLKCPKGYWPHSAGQWPTRDRYNPSQEIIAEILDEGVLLVPKHRHLPRTMLWRFSFSKAETAILKSMTEDQRQCYKILKIIYEKQITGISYNDGHDDYLVDGDCRKILYSYQLKTILMHENEKSKDTMSNREYVTSLLIRLIRCLKENSCPHYFLDNSDILHYTNNEQLESEILKDTPLPGKHYDPIQLLLAAFETALAQLPVDLAELEKKSQMGNTVKLLAADLI